MACGDDSKRKCFTFIWKLENASHCWQSSTEYIESPLFTVDEIHETNWKLKLYPSVDRRNQLGFYLHRETDNAGIVEIKCELAFLSLDGTVLQTIEDICSSTVKNKLIGDPHFASRNEVFIKRKSEFLPQDTLTARCRIWKRVGALSKDLQCFARTRIIVEKRSFLWSIEKFSSLKLYEKKSFEIKSHGNHEKFMLLELFVTGGMIWDETVLINIIPDCQNIKMSTLQLSIVDASKNIVRCFRDEFWYRSPSSNKNFTLFCTKRELLEKKSTFLPNDVLSLWCECAFSCGNILENIEATNSDCDIFEKKKLDGRSCNKENEFPAPNCVLLDDLKSMLNNSYLSDVKLRTKHQTYPAHKSILGARSPVFQAMFSNDMKENINDCVDIEDLSDDTAHLMLRHIYSAEELELDWTSASELFVAADKYQLLSLKNICASHLMINLCLINACEALILADMHQDSNMKSFVQDFILRNGKDIVNSKEWRQLMETNLKLAAETLCLKFKE